MQDLHGENTPLAHTLGQKFEHSVTEWLMHASSHMGCAIRTHNHRAVVVHYLAHACQPSQSSARVDAIKLNQGGDPQKNCRILQGDFDPHNSHSRPQPSAQLPKVPPPAACLCPSHTTPQGPTTICSPRQMLATLAANIPENW